MSQIKHKGLLVVVSGFSGGGKGTLVKNLLSRYDNYSLSVSVTTRKPRPGEKEGIDYIFVDKAHFLNMVKNGEFLEYAQYVDHFYGTPLAFVDEERNKGRDCILEIDIQGGLKVKSKCPEAILVFVTPPSVNELELRLKLRGTESEDVIKKRLLRAGEEAESLGLYDYVLINDDIDEAVKKLHELIKIQHLRLYEQTGIIKKMRDELIEYYVAYNS